MEMNTEEYKGYTIKIMRDEYPESPRDWDNLGTMIYSHSRYILGDTKIPEYYTDDNGDSFDIRTAEDVIQWIKTTQDQEIAVILPLYLYDHSGITMRTTSFSDRWDSGMVGYIYMTKEKIRQEYSVKRITKQLREKVEKMLIGEVNLFDKYISGEIMGYIVEDGEGNHIDSCYGFYDEDECLDEAKNIIDYRVAEAAKAKEEKTKKNIKGDVPLIYR